MKVETMCLILQSNGSSEKQLLRIPSNPLPLFNEFIELVQCKLAMNTSNYYSSFKMEYFNIQFNCVLTVKDESDYEEMINYFISDNITHPQQLVVNIVTSSHFQQKEDVASDNKETTPLLLDDNNSLIQKLCKEIVNYNLYHFSSNNPLSCIHAYLGNKFSELGLSKMAIHHFQLAIDTSNEEPDKIKSCFHANLGEELMEIGELEKSKEHLKLALDLNPNNKYALSYIGYHHFIAGDRDIGKEMLFQQLNDKSLRKEMNSDGCYYIARYYSDIGQFEIALRYFDIAIKHRPNYGRYYYYRGLVEEKLNHEEEAKKDFEKALELSPALKLKRQQTIHL
ncbi:hypothetical protein ABK040_009422 [Willaertia magna]